MPGNSVEEIRLKKGDFATVTLKGLATAGYEWTYAADDKDCVTISKDFAPHGGNDKGYGSSADEIFTIIGVKKGTTIIHFTQQRSWEKNNAVNKKDIKITIED